MENKLVTNQCTGCTSCYNTCPKSAINMVENEEGFMFPQIDSNKCIHCGLCEKRCPALNKKELDNINIDKVLAISTNDEIRKNSSSGGVFTLIANYILEQNGYVCGAAFSQDFKKVEHIIIDKKEDLHKLQSSKYVQSNIGTVYKEIKILLDADKKVLFSGTPCQVDGLNKFLNKTYRNLVTIDVLCHGAPSPKIWREYLEEISQDKTIKKVNFRNKENGWQSPSMLTIDYENHTGYKSFSNKDSYYKAFLKNLILRKSCAKCQYTNLNRTADITLGDFWKIHKFNRKLNDKKGLSMVIPNSTKGKDILNAISKDFIVYKEVPIKYAIKGNPVLKTPCTTHKNRENFFIKLKRKHNIQQILTDSLEEKYDGIIMNFWYAHSNYGAVLTAYAIQQLFREKGYDYRLLNFNPIKNNRKWKNSIAKMFSEKYLHLTKEIKNKRELSKLNALTDTFVVGSDQIFRDHYLNKSYEIPLLTYTDFSKKRVAFSASFGTDSIEKGRENIPIYTRALKRFDSITVREISGIDICKTTLGVEAQHLLDPVFLLNKEKFDSLIDTNENKFKGKIISYILDKTPELSVKKQELEKQTGLEVLDLYKSKLSVNEFLQAIKNCEMLLTDSFHGTCFALLYHKKFLALKNENRGTARFDSLIETFDIKNSFVSNINQLTLENLEKSSIDWENFETRVKEEKIKFEKWFEEIFTKPKTPTEEQIKNEQDFKKYKNKKDYSLKEKANFSKQIFSIDKIGARKVITILGVKIKVH